MSSKTYYCQRRARGWRHLVMMFYFAALLSPFLLGVVLFVVLDQRPFQGALALIGAAGLLFALGNLLNSFVRNEEWEVGIADGALWWRSPRWPKSHGSVHLDDIRLLTVYSHDSYALVETARGEEIKIPFSGPAEDLRRFLGENFPGVRTKLVDTSF